MQLIPVILCGGAGSRLWPVSRELQPKPFIRLEDGESLLQKAFKRAVALPGVDEVVTVTNRELVFNTEDDFRAVNAIAVRRHYVLEPFGRNTAAAIAAAAISIRNAHGDDATLLILAADHVIGNEAAFQDAVTKAMALAADGLLVTFGITPTSAETGYGYIEVNGLKVKRFIEKPPIKQAEEYAASGRFLWNSGMFCFRAGMILDEMKKLCPDLVACLERCIAHSHTAEGDHYKQLQLESFHFGQVPDISIDYAVMERSENLVVVPCDIEWSDVGSWTALAQLSASDNKGNRLSGKTVTHDVSNCYIRGGKRLIGAVGISNLVVVDTIDALLIADRDSVQDVKHLYNALKAEKNDLFRQHATVHRPWGTYTVLEEGSGYKIKRIEVHPGASLSLQMHHHRSEHWIVVSGMAQVSSGDKDMFIRKNESTYIPAGQKHRLGNPGILELVMIEVQSGEYLGEDDIVRFDDLYGRS